MELRGVIVTLLLSQSPWPLLYAVSSLELMQKPMTMIGMGTLFILFFGGLFYLFVPPVIKDSKGILRRNWFYYACCYFSWFCTTALILFLEVTGTITGYLDFYLENGEPYFKTSYGIWLCFLDGTFQYALYLVIIYKYDNRQSYRSIGLYWLLSMVLSMFTTTVGSMVGVYATNVHAGVFFNIPYMLVPIFALKHLLQLKRTEYENVQKPAYTSALSIILILGTVVIFFFSVLRGFAVLGSPLPFVQYYLTQFEPYLLEPGKFGAMYCLFSLIYLAPAQILSLYAYFNGNITWGKDLSLMLSGALAQGTFWYLKASFSMMTPYKYRVKNNFEIVILLNLIPVVISHLLLFYWISHKPKTNKQN